MAARHRGTPPARYCGPQRPGRGASGAPCTPSRGRYLEPQHGPLLGRWRYSRWGAGRSRKPPRTLKLRPSPRIRGDAAEARLRVSEASCASRCLLPPTLAPPSAFGSQQVPFHLGQVPGTVPQEARRPPGPCPSPSQQSSSGPRLQTELYEGPDATRIGTCWRKCQSHLIRSGDGGSTRPPSGLSGGTRSQVESVWVNRLGILSDLESYLGTGGTRGQPSAPPHTYAHTQAQVTGANLPPSQMLPVPPCGHHGPELISPGYDKQG